MSAKIKQGTIVAITMGLPGSGKSTWAKEKCAKDPSFVRVNNDDIREELFGREFNWTPKLEKQVKQVRTDRIKMALKDGKNVIVDNTHLNHKTVTILVHWLEQEFPNVLVEYQDFRDVPLHVCIDRDRERIKRGERGVGSSVIMKMARENDMIPEPPKNPIDWSLPWCIISDLDGSLSLFGKRRDPYDASHCDTIDEPHLAILGVIQTYKALYDAIEVGPNVWAKYENAPRPIPFVEKTFFFSGRTDLYKAPTERFLLTKCGFDTVEDPFFQLVMRKHGDNRGDEIIKREFFDEHVKGKYNVHCIFDDRPKVCRMWREMGLPLFDVGDGIEF
jgi:predicted kinase